MPSTVLGLVQRVHEATERLNPRIRRSDTAFIIASFLEGLADDKEYENPRVDAWLLGLANEVNTALICAGKPVPGRPL